MATTKLTLTSHHPILCTSKESSDQPAIKFFYISYKMEHSTKTYRVSQIINYSVSSIQEENLIMINNGINLLFSKSLTLG